MEIRTRAPAALITTPLTCLRYIPIPSHTRQICAHGPKTSFRSSAAARRPNPLHSVAVRGNGSGIGATGTSSPSPTPIPVGHTPEQAAWLGRIKYYAGREMWRKAEDKFQQVLDRARMARLANGQLMHMFSMSKFSLWSGIFAANHES